MVVSFVSVVESGLTSRDVAFELCVGGARNEVVASGAIVAAAGGGATTTAAAAASLSFIDGVPNENPTGFPRLPLPGDVLPNADPKNPPPPGVFGVADPNATGVPGVLAE